MFLSKWAENFSNSLLRNRNRLFPVQRKHIYERHKEDTTRKLWCNLFPLPVPTDILFFSLQILQLRLAMTSYKEYICWNDSKNARWTKNLIDKVNVDGPYGDFYINQILTGHGVFREHQARFFRKTSLCSCGQGTGSVLHVIKECEIWTSYRKTGLVDSN
ncbi:hypothetical protein AVEN_160077-1 [Araneus ventricosus]|uniref:Uncharacterized protein n=1 Tax=Araneus ventricosus TaxID=182803 RepID=A0A4Y2TRE5_ARAVE|nr:hypothetical protein AVEN_160077-1 [Araneus ventricosus]